jgi:hypothetical protein
MSLSLTPLGLIAPGPIPPCPGSMTTVGWRRSGSIPRPAGWADARSMPDPIAAPKANSCCNSLRRPPFVSGMLHFRAASCRSQ